MRLTLCLLVAWWVGWGASAHAEVVRSTDTGFTVTHSVNVPMPPTAAWAALSNVGRWWDPAHTYSGDARNLTLDLSAGGCFCEKWGMYNSVLHATVVQASMGKLLRLSGGLGPLQDMAVTGTWTWTMEAAGGGTTIKMTYVVGGDAAEPLSKLAPLVDEVMVLQVKRLGRFIATGNPAEQK